MTLPFCERHRTNPEGPSRKVLLYDVSQDAPRRAETGKPSRRRPNASPAGHMGMYRKLFITNKHTKTVFWISFYAARAALQRAVSMFDSDYSMFFHQPWSGTGAAARKSPAPAPFSALLTLAGGAEHGRAGSFDRDRRALFTGFIGDPSPLTRSPPWACAVPQGAGRPLPCGAPAGTSRRCWSSRCTACWRGRSPWSRGWTFGSGWDP